MDLVQLKNLYGHSSLDQTVHYIGLDEDEMRAGLDRLATFLGPLLNGPPAGDTFGRAEGRPEALQSAASERAARNVADGTKNRLPVTARLKSSRRS
jgi:hypothetical protein